MGGGAGKGYALSAEQRGQLLKPITARETAKVRPQRARPEALPISVNDQWRDISAVLVLVRFFRQQGLWINKRLIVCKGFIRKAPVL
jgi:hypothetical protein